MKKIFAILLVFSFTARADYWTQKPDFGGTGRGAASGFYINGKCYIGIGWTFSTVKKDFWEYDIASATWSQKADFGPGNRLGAVGFAIGSKGYIGTGINNGILENDLWEYDPASNLWTQKADFPGDPRDYAVGFELNGMGYLGTGYNFSLASYNDFWQYNPTTDTWTQKANVGGGERSSAIGFSINGKGYIGTGYGAGAQNDFWEYDPLTDTWTQKADAGGGNRTDGVGFSINGKGYIFGGYVGSAKKDLWEYDPLTDSWTQKTSCPGSARSGSVAFSDGTVGYVGVGFGPTLTSLIDFWEYSPDGIVLPIELISLSATQVNQDVEIQWTTTSEMNNDYFTVEKSSDGQYFETLAVIDGAGTSSSLLNYKTMDQHPVSGINYYRLKQTDFDESTHYSDIVQTKVLLHYQGSLELLNIYPNPIADFMMIAVNLYDSYNLQVRLFTTTGQLVLDQVFTGESGLQVIKLDVSGLRSGIYQLHIRSAVTDLSKKVIKIN